MSYYPDPQPSRQTLVRQATKGGFALAGGVALMIFSGLAHIPIVGPIIGAAMLIGGITIRPKNSYASKSDKFSSLALIVLGGVAIATVIPGIKGLADFALGVSSFGLIAFGAVQLFKYWRGMKNR